MSIIDILNRFVSKHTTWDNMTYGNTEERVFRFELNGLECQLECFYPENDAWTKWVTVYRGDNIVASVSWNEDHILNLHDEITLLDLIVR